MAQEYDAIVVGSGPNGLTAAATIAAQGYKTLVLEASKDLGGGTRSAELTLPGFLHDVCSAVHPTGIASPAFKELQLESLGLEWILPEISAAHPLDNEPAALLSHDLQATLESLDSCDQTKYAKLVSPLLKDFENLFPQLLQPTAWPKSILPQVRFGIKGILPATRLADATFKGRRAKALLAGCGAHSILPLDFWGTAAVALVFMLSGHVGPWPVAKGGSVSIAKALLASLQKNGAEVRSEREVRNLSELPSSKVILLDLAPAQIQRICADDLPQSYLRRLGRYEYGPGVHKVDFALSEPIPWKDPRCLQASTVHVGGTLDEISASEEAAWKGSPCDKPFVMVCQQSQFDSTRAPAGKQTGYAYCHVPNGSTRSATDEMELQIERFAPGFKDCIIAKREMTASDFQAYNPSYIGGAITGGAATLGQLFARPVLRMDPYSTPNPKLFLCSHSTPPGGGVHGMCGYNAAKSAMKKLSRS